MDEKCLNPFKINKYWQNQEPCYFSSVENNIKFEDKYFPKDNTWKRISEINPNFEVFENNTTKYYEIKQGSAKDCSFISVLASLSKFPNLIKQKFRKTFTQTGYYEIILFIDGEWQIVFVDDYFPFDTRNTFKYGRPNGNAIWGILLEKAWAKLNGGYSNLGNKCMINSTTALLGIPSEFYPHRGVSTSQLFPRILKSINQGQLLTGSTLHNMSEEGKRLGLSGFHSYSIRNAVRINSRTGEELQLICLYDPHGKVSWTGDWSEQSELWDTQLKSSLLNSDDKRYIFWMNSHDYFKYFCETLICYLPFGQHIRNFYFDNPIYYKIPIIFRVTINKKSKFAIRVFFKGKQSNKDNQSCCACSCLLFQLGYPITKKFDQWSNVFPINLEKNLDSGEYIVWVFNYGDKQSKEKHYVYERG